LRHEVAALLMLGSLALLFHQLQPVQSAITLGKNLITLTFALVFTFAVGLEVVK
jgi:hypothetical protein